MPAYAGYVRFTPIPEAMATSPMVSPVSKSDTVSDLSLGALDDLASSSAEVKCRIAAGEIVSAADLSSARLVSPRCERTSWLATEHAEEESQRRILHGHTYGTCDLGDDGAAEDTFETSRQTSVCRPAVSPMIVGDVGDTISRPRSYRGAERSGALILAGTKKFEACSWYEGNVHE